MHACAKRQVKPVLHTHTQEGNTLTVIVIRCWELSLASRPVSVMSFDENKLCAILAKAGLPHLKDAFVREKVRSYVVATSISHR